MTERRAQIARLNALAEKLGRLTGEAHNLIDSLSARMISRRAALRSIHGAKRGRSASRPKLEK
jgi:hypothetical protein